MAIKNSETTDKITSIVARESNGNIQITFTIPWKILTQAKEETLLELAKDIEIPGFRKGTAPIAKAKEKLSESQIVEHSLSHLLPKALAEAIKDNNLKIAVYPKFEIIKAKDGEDWEIRGLTCELPVVNLGDYKKEVSGSIRAKNIIIPGKEAQEISKEEKESQILKTLLESIKIDIPQILIEEEADSRLSSLLERLEKLGLALESYLASINKKAEDLRSEYAVQAKEAISIDLILNKIAETEKLTIDPKEVDAAYQISQTSTKPNTKEENSDSRKRLIESILRRRKALDYLLSLA